MDKINGLEKKKLLRGI